MQPLEAVVICSSPRTGSGVLCSALWSTNLCGRPDEYLAAATRQDYERLWDCEPSSYGQRALNFGTTSNGVFGIKVHFQHLRCASWIGSGRSPLATLAPRVHFYLVRRRDKVRQAVSLHRAQTTGRFKVLKGTAAIDDEASFDYDAIRRALDEIVDWDRGWDEYFDWLGITPTILTYEEHVEEAYERTARSIIRGLEVAVPPAFAVTTEFHKQSDEVAERLVEQFRQYEADQRRGVTTRVNDRGLR
jgi:LPS sulfotransferase NodH